MVNLVPRGFFDLPRFPSLLGEDDDFLSSLPLSDTGTGLSVSEDDKNIYIEAAVPGVDPDKIEVTFDRGALWVRGQQEQEEKDSKKKYYRRAATAFSYRLTVPGNVDEKAEPQVTSKNGMLRVTFAKKAEVQPKRLAVKKE